MSEHWKTCREAQIACPGCDKMDTCTVSPDRSAFKCWRRSGEIIRLTPGQQRPNPPAMAAGRRRDDGFLTMQVAGEIYARRYGQVAGTWHYHDASGRGVMAVLRLNGPEGKTYRPFHLEQGRWFPGDPEGPLPVYRQTDLPSAARVYVCEGEKATDAARNIGLVCTTSAHGAAAAGRSDWSPLAGKEVIIIPDHDAPGTRYAQDVARLCLSLPEPARVKILELPGLSDGQDIEEWLGYMKDYDHQTLRACIDAYVEKLPWITLAELPASTTPARPSPAPAAAPAQPGEESGPVITRLAEVKPEPINWLWQGKLALGKLSGWAGAPGDGKSIASMDVAARITVGGAWPDGGRAICGSVLLITAEDGLADTIRPRLDVHGADVSRVHHFSMVKRVVNGQAYEQMFTLARLADLEKTLASIGDVRLVIIDPVGSFLGADTDANGDAAVRGVLAPIAALAEKYATAVLLIMHTRKEAGDRADDAVMGSRAFTGIVRCMWHIRRDADNPERRLLLPGKNNTAKALTGLAFEVIDAQGTAMVKWEDKPVSMTADQAVRRDRQSQSSASAGNPIDLWLTSALAAGARPAGNHNDPGPQPGTLLEEARERGLIWRSVQRRAAALEIRRTRTPEGQTLWSLPDPPVA